MNNRIGLSLNVSRKAALALAATVALAAPLVVGMMTAPLLAQSRLRTLDPSAITRTKEIVLQYSLFQIRNAIDRYYAERNRYPSSLDLLTSEGYVSQIPTDPMTNRTGSWKNTPSKADPNNPTAAPGIYDVKSGSEAMALDGTNYSNW